MTNRNSLIAHSRTYYHAIFKDIAWLYGTQLKEMDRDCTHLLSVLEEHGMRIPCIDLPAVAKHFDRCLDEGQFTFPNLPLTRGRGKGIGYPVFLGVLYAAVFHKDGKLRNDASVESIVAIRQIYMGLKKLELPCSQENINDTIEDFLDTEKTLRRATHDWEALLWDVSPKLSFWDNNHRDGRGRFVRVPFKGSTRRALTVLHNVCDIVSVMLGDFANERTSELPKHGPGVVADLRKGEDKYLFRAWSKRLEPVYPFDRYAVANVNCFSYNDEDLPDGDIPSRLICVPKTLKGPRLIAAEPVGGQWIQQLLKRQLEGRLRDTPIADAIDFSSQEKNQIAALKGSASGDNVTIDLKSASDRVSCWTLERVFRRNPDLLLRLSSSRTTKVGGKLLKDTLSMRKFSTMGSACTFPVQSILFACIAVAAAPCVQRKQSIATIREASKWVQVFGDDIVIPKTWFHLVSEYMEALQLRINHDKTFGGVNFRESCGVDAFRGYNVSPTYIKFLPDTKVLPGRVATYVAASNNLFIGGYWHASETLRESIASATSLLPIIRCNRNADGGAYPGNLFGLSSFVGSRDTAFKRYNKDLQVSEHKVLMPIKQSTLTVRDNHASLLQYFTEEPEPIYDWQAGYRKYGRVSLRVGWTQTNTPKSWNVLTVDPIGR